MTNIWGMTDEQILNVIRQSGFNLYGAFKTEKIKIIAAFKALGALIDDDYTIGIGVNNWGNRELTLTLFNPDVSDSFWFTGNMDENEDDDDDVIRYVRLAY